MNLVHLLYGFVVIFVQFDARKRRLSLQFCILELGDGFVDFDAMSERNLQTLEVFQIEFHEGVHVFEAVLEQQPQLGAHAHRVQHFEHLLVFLVGQFLFTFVLLRIQ